MSRYPKPPEGSWAEHYPELGTSPISYRDCTSAERFELEALSDESKNLLWLLESMVMVSFPVRDDDARLRA